MSILFLLSLVIVGFCKEFLDPSKVELAINCGSQNKLDSVEKFVYQKDDYFSENTVVASYFDDPRVILPFRFATDNDLHMTERWGSTPFSYQIPLRKPQEYVLILKFSETQFQYKDQRKFNVKIGDEIVIEALDIYSKVGKFASLSEYIPITYKKDGIYHKGKKIPNGMSNDNMLVILEPIGFDNPKIDAIVLFQGQLQDTDYDQIEIKKAQFIQMETQKKHDDAYRQFTLQNAKLKRVQKIKLRNDQQEDFEEDFEMVIHIMQEENIEMIKKNDTFYPTVIFGVILVVLVVVCYKRKVKLD